MSSKDTVGRTVLVAFMVCLVCAVFVASAAVVLKPAQERNQLIDRQRNILAAAGLLDPSQPITQQFEKVETRVVDLRTGKFTDAVDPASYDQFKAAKSGNPEVSTSFDELAANDIAKIGSREDYSVVYLVRDGDEIEKLVLPVRGYGLWSTMYGFLALEGNFNTVAGLGFYEQGETPGLGGEVDNPNWKQLWVGKEAFDEQGDVALEVIKGHVEPGSPNAEHRIDGLSGATLTTRGVDNLVQFWLGESGYGPFISNLKAGEA